MSFVGTNERMKNVCVCVNFEPLPTHVRVFGVSVRSTGGIIGEYLHSVIEHTQTRTRQLSHRICAVRNWNDWCLVLVVNHSHFENSESHAVSLPTLSSYVLCACEEELNATSRPPDGQESLIVIPLAINPISRKSLAHFRACVVVWQLLSTSVSPTTIGLTSI